jgi:hypothetical protein
MNTALREAVQAELTHGGIRDEIAQCTSIIGALTDDVGIRKAAIRLDDARNAFYDRIVAALEADAAANYEEWHVESIGGGEAGSKEHIEAWLESWREEYGDKYEIHVRRRRVSAWEDVSEEALR